MPRGKDIYLPSPWAVELGRFCTQFNTLPRAGGILDQDLSELYAIRKVNQIEAAYGMDLMELHEAELIDSRDEALEVAKKLRDIQWPPQK